MFRFVRYLIAIISLLMVFSIAKTAYASWSEYKSIRYEDVTGELGGGDKVIVETKHGAGTGTYIEDMRIFKDDYPDLKLIFQIRTLESYFVSPEYNYDMVADVKFTDPSPQDGKRDIIVHTKTVYYKDSEHKVVDREEDTGTKVFKWNGIKFVEAAKRKEVGQNGIVAPELMLKEQDFAYKEYKDSLKLIGNAITNYQAGKAYDQGLEVSYIGIPNSLLRLEGYGLFAQRDILRLKLENARLKGDRKENMANLEKELKDIESRIAIFLKDNMWVD